MTYLYDHFKCKHARENVIKITENLQEEKISAMKPSGQRFAPSAPVRLCVVYAIKFLQDRVAFMKNFQFVYPVALRVGGHGVLCGQSDAASHDHKKNGHLEVA